MWAKERAGISHYLVMADSFRGMELGSFQPAFDFLSPFRGQIFIVVVLIQASDELGGEEGALFGWQVEGFVKDGVEGDGTHGLSLADFWGGARLDRGARVRATKMVAPL